MIYIIVRQSPKYHQMTLEEFLFGDENMSKYINSNETNTRTYEVDTVSYRLFDRLYPKAIKGTVITALIATLENFNETTEELRKKDRHELYHTFYIPKKSGGLRRIDAPLPELMEQLRRLKGIFEDKFHVLYHTAAFAYIKQRCTLDAIKRHQMNESKWFGKYDLHNFFGSTTLDFVMKMLSMVFPFSEIVTTDKGRAELEKAIELSFLDGVLPQGTPISPLITNTMMVPLDFKLSNMLRDFEKQHFIYTRYADDFLISSRYNFDFRKIENLIKKVLSDFEAPFSLNTSKTRYGSSAGSNWNLGVMLNKDNEITVGYKTKRRFQAMLSAYVLDKKNGKQWDKSDVQVMDGLKNYYCMVEKKNIDAIIAHLNQKFGVNIVWLIKSDLKGEIEGGN